MSRSLAAFAVLVGSLTGAQAAPIKGKSEVYYHPTREGDKWVYEVRTGDTTSEMTDQVTKVEKRGTALLVSVQRVASGERVPPLTMSVSNEELSWVAYDGHELSSPAPLLKLRAKSGDSWKWEPTESDPSSIRKMQFTMGNEEEVEVPAGKFKARRVELEMELGGSMLRSTFWYAPGIGVVKNVSLGLDTERVQVLKSFTPGK